MANKYHYLQAPNPRRSPWYTGYQAALTGEDGIYIKAQSYMEMPECWELEWIAVHLNCSADVANRYVKISARSPIGFYYTAVSAAITANQNKYFGIVPVRYPSSGGGEYYENLAGMPIVPGAIKLIGNGDYMDVTVTNGQAADVLTAWFRFRYLNHELGIKPQNEDNQLDPARIVTVTPPVPVKPFPPRRYQDP